MPKACSSRSRALLLTAACFVWHLELLPNFLSASQGRRLAVTAALSSLAVPAVAQEGVPAKVGGRASKWFGSYDDPKHPACERNVVIAFDGTKGKIDGYDKSGAGDEGQFNCRKRRDVTYYDWSLKVKLANKDANEIVVEETGRDVVDRKRINEARETVGKWDKDGILWPDGTKWVQRKWER
ncbi:AP-1 complex subunit gamma-1 [Durusdinium trenchii]|uniref:AP-1 complex subunit gamma-1 n=1 Tax=Durusdinium trenchii TaxID=1381693 RepID=A0ABP0MIM1_9DINO